MNSVTHAAPAKDPQLAGIAIAAFSGLWRIARFPVLALLLVLEPIVRFSLAGIALILTLTALFWHFGAPPGAPLHTFALLAGAVLCLSSLRGYYLVMSLLAL